MARALPYIGAVIGGLYTWSLQGVQYGYMIGSCCSVGVMRDTPAAVAGVSPTIEDLQAGASNDHPERSH